MKKIIDDEDFGFHVMSEGEYQKYIDPSPSERYLHVDETRRH